MKVWKSNKKAIIPILIVFALAGCTKEAKATLVTTTYEFLTEQSTLYVWGRGCGRDLSITGKFDLTVDFDADIASFDYVDANISEPVTYYTEENTVTTQSLSELFRMTELESTYVSHAQIDFVLERNVPQFPNYDIHIRLSFVDNSVHMTGGFSEPIADGCQFYVDAVAVPEPATLFLVGLGALMLRKGN